MKDAVNEFTTRSLLEFSETMKEAAGTRGANWLAFGGLPFFSLNRRGASLCPLALPGDGKKERAEK